MNQAKAFLGAQIRKSFQPSQAFFTNLCEDRGNHLLEDGKQWRKLWLSGGKLSQTLRGPKHLIGIPANPGPPEGADLVDDVRRVSSPGSQIPAMENQVRCHLLQVGEHGLEGPPIAVNIRYDGNSHFARCPVAIMA